jgi:diaminopimelate epimerase
MMDGMTTLTSLPFAKGHGTGNDFVLVPDPDGRLDLDAATVAAICDRRFGIGGDGLLRVVRTSAVPSVADHADEAEWFMDYRNADGSVSEMCGNGVRVFARYLVDSGLAEGPEVAILTRAGRVVAEVGAQEIAVDMPLPVVAGESVAQLSGVDYKGTVVSVGNPHLVCWVDDPSSLELTGPPGLDPAVFPAGANVEFIARTGDGQLRMRVIERGVGETLSCGSGACAAGAVALRDAGLSDGTVTVDVPGGRLAYSRAGDRCVLAGPAVIVATGTLLS